MQKMAARALLKMRAVRLGAMVGVDVQYVEPCEAYILLFLQNPGSSSFSRQGFSDKVNFVIQLANALTQAVDILDLEIDFFRLGKIRFFVLPKMSAFGHGSHSCCFKQHSLKRMK